jgi:hypothetical protein
VDADTGYPLNFSLSVRPLPDDDAAQDACNPINVLIGDRHTKNMCLGVNIDQAGCDKAAKPLPINGSAWLSENTSAPDWVKNSSEWLECSNCFLGFGSDIIFDVSWKSPSFHCSSWKFWKDCHADFVVLEHLSIGFDNMHVRGGLELRAHYEHEWKYDGKYDLPEISMPTWTFWAGMVPITMDFSIPTALTYEFKLDVSSELRVGASVDFDLGRHMLEYKDGKFQPDNTGVKVSWQPVFDAKGQLKGTVTLGIESSLSVLVEKMLRWNLNFKPSVPISAELDVEICPIHAGNKLTDKEQVDICHDVGADFEITHSASLEFNYFVGHATLADFGPWTLYTMPHKDLVPKTCNRLSGDCGSHPEDESEPPEAPSTTPTTPEDEDESEPPEAPSTTTEISTTTTTESTTTTSGSTTTTPGNCEACMTVCAPCKICTDQQDGACYKCWHCWDYDDNEL